MFKSKKYRELESDYFQLQKAHEKLKSRIISLLWDKEKLELVNKLLEKYQILGIEENNQKQKYYVCLDTSDNSVNVSLRDDDQDKKVPRIDTDIRYNRESKENTCFITSFFAINEDVGNGSILMDYLFEYLKKMGIKKVRGKLGSIDNKNFDKLEYFYEKNGFKVTFFTNRNDGEIEKIL